MSERCDVTNEKSEYCAHCLADSQERVLMKVDALVGENAALRASVARLRAALRQAALDLGNIYAMTLIGELVPLAIVSAMADQAKSALADAPAAAKEGGG